METMDNFEPIYNYQCHLWSPVPN